MLFCYFSSVRFHIDNNISFSKYLLSNRSVTVMGETNEYSWNPMLAKMISFLKLRMSIKYHSANLKCLWNYSLPSKTQNIIQDCFNTTMIFTTIIINTVRNETVARKYNETTRKNHRILYRMISSHVFITGIYIL